MFQWLNVFHDTKMNRALQNASISDSCPLMNVKYVCISKSTSEGDFDNSHRLRSSPEDCIALCSILHTRAVSDTGVQVSASSVCTQANIYRYGQASAKPHFTFSYNICTSRQATRLNSDRTFVLHLAI